MRQVHDKSEDATKGAMELVDAMAKRHDVDLEELRVADQVVLNDAYY